MCDNLNWNQMQAGYAKESTLLEQQEKSAKHYQEQADKAAQGAQFLRDNTVFAEFIKLVRKGALQF